MDNLETKIIENEQRSKSNTHRIDTLEKKVDDITQLTIGIHRLSDDTHRLAEEMKEQGQRIAKLESKPADKWDKVTVAAITAAVTALISIAIQAIG